ncbi:hypothetical protein FHR51_000997 [Xanthomonas arboricola]|nr:hypothetical protein [Xanthomonas cannabis]
MPGESRAFLCPSADNAKCRRAMAKADMSGDLGSCNSMVMPGSSSSGRARLQSLGRRRQRRLVEYISFYGQSRALEVPAFAAEPAGHRHTRNRCLHSKHHEPGLGYAPMTESPSDEHSKGSLVPPAAPATPGQKSVCPAPLAQPQARGSPPAASASQKGVTGPARADSSRIVFWQNRSRCRGSYEQSKERKPVHIPANRSGGVEPSSSARKSPI